MDKDSSTCACTEQTGKRAGVCLDIGLGLGLLAFLMNVILLLIVLISPSPENSASAVLMLILAHALAMLMLVLMCRVSICSSLAGGIGLILFEAQVGALFVEGGNLSIVIAFQLICLAIGLGGLTRYLLLGKKRRVAMGVLIAAVVAEAVLFIEGVSALFLVAKGKLGVGASDAVVVFTWWHFIATVVCLVAIASLCLVSKQIVKVVESRRRIDVLAHEEIKVSRLLFALGLIAGFIFLKVSRVGANFLEASAGITTNVLGGILLPWILVLAAAYFLVGFLASLVDRCIHGRMRRMPYFLSCLLLGGPINIAGVFLRNAAAKEGGLEAQLFVSLCAGILHGLVMFYFWVKRAHDIGWTSKLAIWMLIFSAGPAVGYIYPALGAFVYVAGALPLLIMSVLLLFVPGTQGANKFGERKDMSVQGRLASLKDLHDKGLMTDLEYEKKRKDILDSF